MAGRRRRGPGPWDEYVGVFYVYILCYPDGEPFYVGKGTYDRAWKTRSRGGYLGNVISKIRESGKEHGVIITKCENEEEAFLLEKSTIARFGRRVDGGLLVNHTDGGEGMSGFKWTQDMRNSLPEKIRSSLLTSPVAKAYYESLKGRSLSPETRQKMSDSRRGTVMSEEQKLQISQSAIERGKTDEHLTALRGGALRRRGVPDETPIQARSAFVRLGRKDPDSLSDVEKAFIASYDGRRRLGKRRVNPLTLEYIDDQEGFL